ncbi:hypothetical protein JOJ87_005211 [Rhodococcus ruber]|nr:hypothetical protein [Rhodococcus ruber]NCL77973.1 hypothetical protein [Rhodococcus sp. YH1]NCL78658.1 hypothetical protein [Rhodococcus sp. YH1]
MWPWTKSPRLAPTETQCGVGGSMMHQMPVAMLHTLIEATTAHSLIW